MEKEFHRGVSDLEYAKREIAENRSADIEKAEWDTIVGLEGAKTATEKTIAKYREKGMDASEFETHLASLKKQLMQVVNESVETTARRIEEYRQRGIDVTFLQQHLDNLKAKLLEAEGEAKKAA